MLGQALQCDCAFRWRMAAANNAHEAFAKQGLNLDLRSFVLENSYIEVYESADRDATVPHVAFAVLDIAAAEQELAKLGIDHWQLDLEGTKLLFFRDPAGNQIGPSNRCLSVPKGQSAAFLNEPAIVRRPCLTPADGRQPIEATKRNCCASGASWLLGQHLASMRMATKHEEPGGQRVLYGYWLSPFMSLVAQMLNESGLDFRYERVSPYVGG